jgi:hypothetical protein
MPPTTEHLGVDGTKTADMERFPAHQHHVDGPKTGHMVRFSAHRRSAATELERMRLRAPSRVANASRNAQAGFDRHRRWAPARDALWEFLAPHLKEGARVAVVGAGNGDDLPLRRIARHAGAVTLIDLDPSAARGARRRLGRAERRKVTVIGHDVTVGAADAVVLATLDGVVRSGAEDLVPETLEEERSAAPNDPLPGAPYDLVIGDLFYSQLLYPALLDLGVEPIRRDEVLARQAPSLTRAVVARLHASAPRVVHLHDPLAWWDGHEQPISLDEILTRAAGGGSDAALALATRGNGPHESDPRAALHDLGLTPTGTALWRWPFAPGVDYLVASTLAVSGTGKEAS